MMWKIQQAMQDGPPGHKISSPFHPGNHETKVFLWQNFQPVYRDPSWKNQDLGNWASLHFTLGFSDKARSHVKRPKIYI